MSTQDLPHEACACDGDVTALTPASLTNLSGRSALAYRVGTHGSFTATMRAALARLAALAGLTTRKEDDPSIALLDAWAAVLDVLTFYQERIANEAYIRTATEQRSVLELARAIGYELNPGVAASAFLAFTVDETEGSPASVTLEAGTKVQSVPGQDELPQIFETTETFEARREWNTLTPQAAEQLPPQIGTSTISLQGISTNLKVGDGLLIVGDERVRDPTSRRWDFRRVKTVTAVLPPTPTTDSRAGRTIVELDRSVGVESPARPPAKENPKVYALRQRAALFGYNAPDWLVMSKQIKEEFGDDGKMKQWPRFNIAYEDSAPPIVDRLYLDAVYPAISLGSWLIVSLTDSEELYSVRSVADASKTEFAITGKTTYVDLDGPALPDKYADALRDIVVYATSELLDWADTPILDPVSGGSLTLKAQVDGLTSGHLLMASGADADTGEPRSEAVTLARTALRDGLTKLVFTTALQHPYRRETLTMYGNVARATHGETRTEILGSGNGSRPFRSSPSSRRP